MKDKIERKISKITKDLIMQSLFRAVSAKRPEPASSITQTGEASTAPMNMERSLISSA
jgi:hypothetical protein